MSIKVRREEEGYSAEVAPSPKLPAQWKTDKPLYSKNLTDRFLELGYHLQEIVDAFMFADPNWISHDE